MTREEAISWLVSLTEHEGEDVPIYDTDVEALDMAISALEHPERNVVDIVPCGDTISRQAVLDLINADWKYENLEIAINNLPSVTPQEPRKGQWINICDKNLHDYRTGNKLRYQCSECKSQYTYKYSFCPNCGADMREVEE